MNSVTIKNDLKSSIEQQLYPFTLRHILYFIVFTVVTTYITNYFMNFRLLKWIYIGTVIVLGANMYKSGNNKEVAEDIFKLATI